MARLKDRYAEEIRPQLKERFGYTSTMQVPRIEKITLNMGVGEAKQDTRMLEAATEQLATIAGQRPSVRRARKSIAAFKLREGMPVGISVTLRRERAYEFLDRLLSVAIPRIRDFRGLKTTSFDGRGNYSIGLREQVIFPEIDYDAVDQIRGLDVTITTTAKTDDEARALLQAFGMPFARDPRAVQAAEDVIAEVEERVGGESYSGGAPVAGTGGGSATEGDDEPTQVQDDPKAAGRTETPTEPGPGGEDAPGEQDDTTSEEA